MSLSSPNEAICSTRGLWKTDAFKSPGLHKNSKYDHDEYGPEEAPPDRAHDSLAHPRRFAAL
jgi:hypothetical protein